MVKFALLIGVGSSEGLDPLPCTQKNIEALQQVLQHPERGGFTVTLLSNPDVQTMQIQIGKLFDSRKKKDDVVLLYFAGHGIKDEKELHLATSITSTEQGELSQGTAVPASYIRKVMGLCISQRQVVILDCCFSGAFGDGLVSMADDSVDVKAQLGGEGRVVLTSSASNEYSFAQETEDLSIYTRYLVEGLETGAAARNGKSEISVEDVHEYTSEKVREAKPRMNPAMYTAKNAHTIILAQAPVNDPKLAASLEYRQEVEYCVRQSKGKISPLGRRLLNSSRQKLGLTSEEAEAIEQAVLKPYEDYQKNLREYEEAYSETVEEEYPLGEANRNILKRYQQQLGLRDEDVQPIEAKLNPQTPLESAELPDEPPPWLDASPPQLPQPTPGRQKPRKESEKGVNYDTLEQLLAAKNWQEADAETGKKMLEVAGQQERGYLDHNDIKKFPCQDLCTIDQLWVYYSDERFGFSIQKEIWQSLGSTDRYDKEIVERFCDRTGWRVNGKLKYPDFAFGTHAKAPRGYLPACGDKFLWFSGSFLGVSLFSRIKTCQP